MYCLKNSTIALKELPDGEFVSVRTRAPAKLVEKLLNREPAYRKLPDETKAAVREKALEAVLVKNGDAATRSIRSYRAHKIFTNLLAPFGIAAAAVTGAIAYDCSGIGSRVLEKLGKMDVIAPVLERLLGIARLAEKWLQYPPARETAVLFFGYFIGAIGIMVAGYFILDFHKSMVIEKIKPIVKEVLDKHLPVEKQ